MFLQIILFVSAVTALIVLEHVFIWLLNLLSDLTGLFLLQGTTWQSFSFELPLWRSRPTFSPSWRRAERGRSETSSVSIRTIPGPGKPSRLSQSFNLRLRVPRRDYQRLQRPWSQVQEEPVLLLPVRSDGGDVSQLEAAVRLHGEGLWLDASLPAVFTVSFSWLDSCGDAQSNSFVSRHKNQTENE